jgi:hypothetical protein
MSRPVKPVSLDSPLPFPFLFFFFVIFISLSYYFFPPLSINNQNPVSPRGLDGEEAIQR